MDFFPYNSKNTLHKSKYGALCEGESVTFRVIMPRFCHVSSVCLIISRETGETESHSFSWDRMEGDSEEWWVLEYIPKRQGLYWYDFRYTTPQGTFPITCMDKGIGVMTDRGRRWQLTVYKKDFETPNWLKGGLIYQIFPDRFFFSGEQKSDVPSDRIIRTNPDEQPYWQPDCEGIVRNNDYFCGDLKGVTEKLDYLEGLGVTCIYLNPVFEAHSNHRYDTADYEKIDPLLGTEEDLKALCSAAKEKGIAVILDGVFSHTGADSRYFNKNNRYKSLGAFNSQSSPFYSWYSFSRWNDKYSCWWDIKILPEVNETDKNYLEYITGENGIARKWLRAGVSGWRLDVADELPDVFLDSFRRAVKAENPDGLVLGEVWEDASNKISYSHRRRYLLGDQLDSVMNYPFADAILSFVRSGVAENFSDGILSVLENYPPQVVNVLMNHIGTHDTLRAITYLAGESCEGKDRQWQSEHRLSPHEYSRGVKLLKLASLMQYTLPGVPSLYYGDEAGMEGYRDPFNRCCYPWGKENGELLDWYKKLGAFRKAHKVFTEGSFQPVSEMLGCVAYRRICPQEEITVIINRNEHEIDYRLPSSWQEAEVELCGEPSESGVRVAALGSAVLVKRID